MEDRLWTQTRTDRVRAASTAYQTAAWRAPATPRFDSRPANDFGRKEPVRVIEAVQVQPTAEDQDDGGVRWLVAIAGAVVVALLAVFAANAMAV